MDYKLLSTPDAIAAFLDTFTAPSKSPPKLFIDLEGDSLSRNGTISPMTVLVEGQAKVYLLDVTTLEAKAFSTAGTSGQTMKQVMESKNFTKVFFDIRHDSDALFGLYGIKVNGIEDLQLMELASRRANKRLLNGLAKCIERDAQITSAERQQWQAIKEKGLNLFAPERGGSYAVFNERPLSDDMAKYCCQDVTLMPHLRQLYKSRLSHSWWIKVEAETAERIRYSQSPTYNGKGRHMAEGPRAWKP